MRLVLLSKGKIFLALARVGQLINAAHGVKKTSVVFATFLFCATLEGVLFMNNINPYF